MTPSDSQPAQPEANAPVSPPAPDSGPAAPPAGSRGTESSTPKPSPSGDGASPPGQGGAGGTQKQPVTMVEAIAQELKILQQKAEPAKRKPKAAPEGQPEGAGLGEAPDAKPAKESEDVTTPPEGLTPRGQERWSKLTAALKEKDAKLERHAQELQRAEAELETMRGLLRDARATPEDFGTALEYIKAVRTGDLATAQKILLTQLKELQVAIGRPIEPQALDALADFPDLRDAVEKYQISEDKALEVAKARRLQEAQRAQAEETARQQAAFAAFAKERDQAIEDIREMVKKWKDSDLDFAYKEPKIAEKIARLKLMPPRFWPSQVKQFYEDLNEAISLAGGLKRPSEPAQAGPSARPLSGSGGPSGTQRVPNSMLEAIRQALGQG